MTLPSSYICRSIHYLFTLNCLFRVLPIWQRKGHNTFSNAPVLRAPPKLTAMTRCVTVGYSTNWKLCYCMYFLLPVFKNYIVLKINNYKYICTQYTYTFSGMGLSILVDKRPNVSGNPPPLDVFLAPSLTLRIKKYYISSFTWCRQRFEISVYIV